MYVIYLEIQNSKGSGSLVRFIYEKVMNILLQGVCLFVQRLSDSNISQNVKTTIISCKTSL